MFRRSIFVLLLFAALPCLSQQGPGGECTPAGVWYGGSVTAYQMTVFPTMPAGTYMVLFDGMYKAAPITSKVTGTITKKGTGWEGSMLTLIGDASFVDQLPGMNGKMPDLLAGWFKIEMLDCNTIRNTMPFLGMYFAPGIWEQGSPWAGVNWVASPDAKVPFITPPDQDMIPILTLGGDKPIVETYRRLGTAINPVLLHQE